jgi:hypothetical protein
MIKLIAFLYANRNGTISCLKRIFDYKDIVASVKPVAWSVAVRSLAAASDRSHFTPSFFISFRPGRFRCHVY